MQVVELDTIAGQVLAAPAAGRTRVIGVDGPSASGKSTFVRELRGRLPGASLVEIDEFVSWNDFSGWWPRFLKEVLIPIHEGRDAHYQVRDFVNDEFGTSLGAWKTVPWSPLLLVDGVTCTRFEARSFLSFSIWVEAPREERLRRGVERDGESHRELWLRWMEEERAFFSDDDTREQADLRINAGGGTSQDRAVFGLAG